MPLIYLYCSRAEYPPCTAGVPSKIISMLTAGVLLYFRYWKHQKQRQKKMENRGSCQFLRNLASLITSWMHAQTLFGIAPVNVLNSTFAMWSYDEDLLSSFRLCNVQE